MKDTLIATFVAPANYKNRGPGLLFAGSASRIDGRKIGFLPWSVYHAAAEAQQLCQIHRNGDLVGFCMARPNKLRELRIIQIWVRPDARLIEHGRALLEFVEKNIAAPHGATVVRLWCAEDLAANLFWDALGFTYRGWRWGNHKRPRRHKLWTRQVVQPHYGWQPKLQVATIQPTHHPALQQQALATDIKHRPHG